jgi:hypothetical protein
MPTNEYETRTDSVLAWKKAQKLGRFDPDAPSLEQQKIRAFEREIEERGKTNLYDALNASYAKVSLTISAVSDRKSLYAR